MKRETEWAWCSPTLLFLMFHTHHRKELGAGLQRVVGGGGGGGGVGWGGGFTEQSSWSVALQIYPCTRKYV